MVRFAKNSDFLVVVNLIQYINISVLLVPDNYLYLHSMILFLFYRFVIVYKKGYQQFDSSISTVTTKLKGTTFVDFGNFNSTLFNGIRIYDPTDYVIPPQVSVIRKRAILKQYYVL